MAGKGGVDPKLQLLARLGFLARGVVYVVIGAVAARVALLNRGKTTGPAGALRRIFELGHGQTALVAVGVGLLSFALFRFVQAGRVKGAAKIGYLVGAVGALFLTASAAGLLLGLRRRGPSPLREAEAWLLAHPWGRALLGLGGAIACVAGLVEIVRGLIGRLPRDFEAAVMERGRKRWALRLARLGVFAHGAVVGTVGASIVQAALDLDEREIMGTGGALRFLSLATSPVVFAVVAVGLVAYGVSLLVLAAHRRSRLR